MLAPCLKETLLSITNSVGGWWWQIKTELHLVKSWPIPMPMRDFFTFQIFS